MLSDFVEVLEFKSPEKESNNGTDSEEKGPEYVYKSFNEETTTKECNLIWIDPGSCYYALYWKLPSDRVLQQQPPLVLSKALKNPVALDGFRKAYIHDGAFVVNYLAWLDRQMQEIYGNASYFS